MNQRSVLKLVLTLVSESPTGVAKVLSKLPEWLNQENFHLEGQEFLSNNHTAIDVFISYFGSEGTSDLNPTDIKSLLVTIWQDLNKLLTPYKVDYTIQEVTPATRRKKVFCSDMDSTIIENETLDDFARLAGIADEVEKITKLGMEGKIDFEESLSRRLALLKGVNATDFLNKTISLIKINPGADTVLATLQKNGVTTMLVSGGFHPMATVVQEQLGFDLLYCNTFDMDGHQLTGKLNGKPVTGEKKLEYFKNTLTTKGLLFENGCALGDGANDLPMIRTAGLGVAYKAKPVVKQSVCAAIEHTDLTTLLYFQGYHAEEFVKKN